MRSILDALEINKNASPERIAVSCEEDVLNYSELYEYSDRLANKLKKIGLVKGDVVALMFPNIIEFVVSYFAVLKAGGVVLTINIIDSVEDIRYVLEDSRVRCIIYWDKFRDLFESILKGLKGRVLSISLGGRDLKNQLGYKYSSGEISDKYKSIDIEENDISSILYTSGTTGPPRGAMHSYKNFAFVSKIWKELLAITPDDKFLAILPLFHPFSQSAILNPCIWCGATLVTLPKLDITETIRVINEKGITLLYVVPEILKLLLKKYEQEKFEL